METTLDRWVTPSDYAGFDPVGHLGVMTIHRDSGLLDRVNWEVACERMAGAAGFGEVPFLPDWQDQPDEPSLFGGDPGISPAVYWWEASHWAVGWVRYLMVRPDAPEAVLTAAQEIRDDMADYPVLDEERYSDAEYEQVTTAWAEMSVKERLDVIRWSKSRDISPFAARRDELPDDDGGWIYEYLRED